MATSNSTDFTRNRNEIIKEALEILNVVGVGEEAQAEDIQTASNTLNMMVKSWQGQGRHLWGMTEATVLVNRYQGMYLLPGAQGSNDVVKTELSADEAAAQTVISLDSSEEMSASDIVVIELDTGILHSSTIASVDDATTITITDALPSLASEDNHVYTYTTAIGRPLRVLHARWRDANENDRELMAYSREEYFNISDKDAKGKPQGYYYDPQLNNSKLYLWPTPDSVKGRLNITYERTLEDFDGGTDSPDFPQEWLMALTWNLALNLGVKFEVDSDKLLGIVAPLARQYLNDALDFDVEHTQFSFSPDMRG